MRTAFKKWRDVWGVSENNIVENRHACPLRGAVETHCNASLRRKIGILFFKKEKFK